VVVLMAVLHVIQIADCVVGMTGTGVVLIIGVLVVNPIHYLLIVSLVLI
jgi:hypothetical protein